MKFWSSAKAPKEAPMNGIKSVMTDIAYVSKGVSTESFKMTAPVVTLTMISIVIISNLSIIHDLVITKQNVAFAHFSKLIIKSFLIKLILSYALIVINPLILVIIELIVGDLLEESIL